MKNHTILVTGGAGYIGSHTCVELLEAGFQVVVLDNLCNSSPESLRRVAEIIGREHIPFHQGDIRDAGLLDKIFQENKVYSVIHFAGLKAVGESVEKPLAYYDNNVAGTVALLQAMQRGGVKNIVFSSSATVYGDPHTTPIQEHFPLSATNPYGRSKLMIEEMLGDLYKADPEWKIALLRYFNPVGAHISGRIGEDPRGVPNNLMPYIARVAVGQYESLSVFGGDYPTHDGTGVRDYIHVVDLARGHVKALQAFLRGDTPNLLTVNLGTGQGYSVLDMVKAFAEASGRDIPYRIVARRPGDIACCYADPALAGKTLQWKAEKTLADMCRDSWNWQQQNPVGYS
ncbi:UDP-glucose 4-epimerase GalE [Candidatus Thiothrix sp. Deng01]|uniref:UDP-glucose 4-epimerase n=1 Tax=Candidatus Thiothrix phosphatis TaxID=3112415 RepID=A0ABU6D1P4_9GAMM|nr:UDP-glucose 4-epimerase GalE [Candidatus Thiothrix sp. Deng01]MEB4592727.1 UDP-glucose 4-epimerase GalE [Candidatus Thiothrix sp. Deng01]